MLKKINNKIYKLEEIKNIKNNKLCEIQKEIEELDTKLKKLNNLKKDWEKLEKSTEDVFEQV